MKVYVLASGKNLFVANELLNRVRKIKNLEIKTTPTTSAWFESLKNAMKRRVECADVILVLIDEEFVQDSFLTLQLEWARAAVRKSRRKLLIPIVLGQTAELPDCIKNTEYHVMDPLNNISYVAAHIESELAYLQHTGYMVDTSVWILVMALSAFLVMRFAYFLSSAEPGVVQIMKGTGSPLEIIAVVVMGAAVGFICQRIIAFADKQAENAREAYSLRLQEAITPEGAVIRGQGQDISETPEPKPEIDALGLMRINLEDIKEFYTWSQKQAKAAFALAVGMCLFGGILLLIAIFLPFVHQMELYVSIIPAVGGVITELVAGTALVVYRNSLAQLNHYHQALHEDERFLSSVNLLGRFSTVEDQDNMLREIIQSEIQMNMAGVPESAKGEKTGETAKP